MSIEGAAPRNREELVARLADLRMQGVIEGHEEERLLGQFDGMVRDMDAEKARVEPEYRRRIQEDGLDKANDWLREMATELGRRHGEATRAITDQLRVVTG